ERHGARPPRQRYLLTSFDLAKFGGLTMLPLRMQHGAIDHTGPDHGSPPIDTPTIMAEHCLLCDDTGWVCENHPDAVTLDRACWCGKCRHRRAHARMGSLSGSSPLVLPLVLPGPRRAPCCSQAARSCSLRLPHAPTALASKGPGAASLLTVDCETP